MKLRELLWPSKPEPLKPGIHHTRIDEGERHFRLHLRVEPSGRGILVINASKILHLNETAAEIAKRLIDGLPVEKIVKTIRSRYKVSKEQALNDVSRLREQIYTLAATDDVCPVSYLDVRKIEPFSVESSAPYRMDLALTYRCDNNCGHCYVARKRDTAELSVERWKQVLDKCWKAGIPHVCFTGGEPLLYEGLVELISHAEDTGIVTGLLTDGRKLADAAFLDKLVAAGIDHIQITIESSKEEVHDRMVGCEGAWKETVEGLKNAVRTPVFTMTNTTLTQLNAPHVAEIFKFIAGLGVRTAACNGMIHSGKGERNEIAIPEDELKGVLGTAQRAASSNDLRLIWYTPTRYCNFDPVELGLGLKQCTAARLNMCVEPDGGVIPCQSYYRSCGNMLADEFEKIWQSDLCREIRGRSWIEEKCRTCEKLKLCEGGCPLYPREGAILCPDSHSVT